jgi:hypothetical protein
LPKGHANPFDALAARGGQFVVWRHQMAKAVA